MAEKLKMSRRKFMLIWIPLIVILLGVIIAVTVVANTWSQHLDTYVGRGERVVNSSSDTSGWDVDYYDRQYQSTEGADGSKVASAVVAQEISNEGTVLMKNTGALPLAQSSKIAPFGFRYYTPFYGGTGSGNVDVTADYVVSPDEALASNFTVVGTFDNVTGTTQVNKYVYEVPSNAGESDVLAFFNYSGGWSGSDQSVYEFDTSVYNTGAITDKSGTTAVVFIGRGGGENNDLWTVPYNKVGQINAADAAKSNITLNNSASTDAVEHALELLPEEKATITLAKSTCNQVVVIIDSSNAIELGSLADDSGIDAILWIGGPGAKGFQSMSDIMAGKVNPSGKLVDTYVRDVKEDPVWKNFGDLDGYIYSNTNGLGPVSGKHYANSRKSTNPMTYVEYEEGMYMGYKYYETAYDTGLTGFTYGALNTDGSTKTAGQVVYPFGHGLSYSGFTQEIVDFTGNKDTVSVKVKVTNTGDYKGKDVVQVYFTSPYTSIDKQYGIEKPTAMLAGFVKTGELAANGGTDNYTVEFNTDEMASYCYTVNNSDGTTGSYMLDAGTYTVSVRSDSHNVLDSETFDIADTIWLTGDNPRRSEKDGQSKLDDKTGEPLTIPAAAESDTSAKYIAASNNFTDSNKYMAEAGTEALTRGTASGLSLSTITAAAKYGKAAPDWVVTKLGAYDPNTDTQLGNAEGSEIYRSAAPAEGESNNMVVSSFRGLSYYDPLWDDLLDQLDYSQTELHTFLFTTSYAINKLDVLGIAAAKALDGPQGLTLSDGFVNNSACAFSSAPVIAATFNVKLGYAFGEAVGQEALTMSTMVTGWYAPGLNTHRSPFSGRNFEYYSEDGVLAGKICARVISGAGDQGVASHIKHFALNDHESNRANICVWANEQVIREIYLKPFEIALKEARQTIKYIADENGTVKTKTMRAGTAVMTSYNNIGIAFASGHYGLLTGTLRNEWGFQGAVISDMTQGAATRRDQMIRAGNDYVLTSQTGVNATDLTGSTAKWAMRRAVHNIAYTYANSNAMQGVAPGATAYYTMSPWAIWLLIANIVVYLVILGGAVWVVLRYLAVRKNPDRYKSA